MAKKTSLDKPAQSASQSQSTKQTQPSTAETEVVHGLIDIERRDITLILESGYLFIEMKKHKEAEEVFLGVAALLPTSEVPHLALGNLYFAQGRFAQALKSHEQALELNPKSATAHTSAAEALFFLRRHDEALKLLGEAEQLEAQGPAFDFAKALREAHELGIFA